LEGERVNRAALQHMNNQSFCVIMEKIMPMISDMIATRTVQEVKEALSLPSISAETPGGILYEPMSKCVGSSTKRQLELANTKQNSQLAELITNLVKTLGPLEKLLQPLQDGPVNGTVTLLGKTEADDEDIKSGTMVEGLMVTRLTKNCIDGGFAETLVAARKLASQSAAVRCDVNYLI
jgi:hypothetical protein